MGPDLELPTFGCSNTHNNTLHVLQRTTFGSTPHKAGVIEPFFPIVSFPPGKMARGKNYYRSVVEEKWLYSRISPRKNGYIVGFPPPRKNGYIVGFPPPKE